jgi:hypothetical protein
LCPVPAGAFEVEFCGLAAPDPDPVVAAAVQPVGAEAPDVPAWVGWAPALWVPAAAAAPQVLPFAVWPLAAAPERPVETDAG